MKLSILICTIPGREKFLERLRSILDPQVRGCEDYIEILVNHDPNAPIGLKRNVLLAEAIGEYVCFIDDDDRVSDDYVLLLLEGIFKGVDCCSLIGIITDNGDNPRKFYHSIKYQHYETVSDPSGYASVMYLRYPNHLNCIKSSIAKNFRFPEKNFGEDTDFATQIHHSGQLMTEHEINKVIYYYDWVSKK